jgi:hypothetical protein
MPEQLQGQEESAVSSPAMEGVHDEQDPDAQFWGKLEEILAPVGSAPEDISVDLAVRNFIQSAAAFRGIPLI